MSGARVRRKSNVVSSPPGGASASVVKRALTHKSCPDIIAKGARNRLSFSHENQFTFNTPFRIACYAQAQSFSALQTSQSDWRCRGRIWIVNSDLYCKDVRSKELTKWSSDGRKIFSHLERPADGSSDVFAVAEDAAGNIYATDGGQIHAYSPDGSYLYSLTPGVEMNQGLAVLDAEHIFVSGRSPTSGATVFLVGSNGIERSFSSPFVAGLTGVDDRVANWVSFLALDRGKRLLYQLPQDLYEIRVFDLNGKLLRKIVPPAEYRTRAPELQHPDGGGVFFAPGDGLSDITVVPGGGLIVTGMILDSAKTSGKVTSVNYSRFVDLYDSSGKFRRRFTNDELELDGAKLLRFDSTTARAFFKNGNSMIVGELN